MWCGAREKSRKMPTHMDEVVEHLEGFSTLKKDFKTKFGGAHRIDSVTPRVWHQTISYSQKHVKKKRLTVSLVT
jgi:hypothetical protein